MASEQQDYTLFLGKNNLLLMSLDEANARVGIATYPEKSLDVSGSSRFKKAQYSLPPNKFSTLYTINVIDQSQVSLLNGSYTVYISDNSYTNEGYFSFDGNPDSYWQSRLYYSGADGSYTFNRTTTVSGVSRNGEWIKLQIPNAMSIDSYTLTSLEFNQSPKDWWLAGSSDNNTWTLLDTKTNVTNWGASKSSQTFSISSSEVFKYFMLIFNKCTTNTDGHIALTDIYFTTRSSDTMTIFQPVEVRDGEIKITETRVNDRASLLLDKSGLGTLAIQHGGNDIIFQSWGDKPYRIYGTQNEWMTIKNNVGINQTNPQYSLDVNGTVKIGNNNIKNKLLILYDNVANESLNTATNFYGFGINPSVLRYQVPSGNNHGFYNGGTEIMRISSDRAYITKVLGIFATDPKGSIHCKNDNNNDIVIDTKNVPGYSYIGFNGCVQNGEQIFDSTKTRYRLLYDIRGNSDKFAIDYYTTLGSGDIISFDGRGGFINIPKRMRLNLASDDTGKASYAGWIGYQVFSFDCLDIVGAGTVDGQRRVQIYDQLGIGRRPTMYHLDVQGSINFTGNLYRNGELIEFNTGGGGGGTVTIPDPLIVNSVLANNMHTLNFHANIHVRFGPENSYYGLGTDNVVYNNVNEIILLMNFRNEHSPGDLSSTSHWFYQSGRCLKRNNETFWNVYSDLRLKENVQTLENGLDIITKLRPVSFEWKNKARGNKIYNGFIAQEYQEILPDHVTEMGIFDNTDKELLNDDKCLVLTPEILPHLVSAIKELNEIIKMQQNKIDELYAKISQLNI
jgi:hypothetical protein